SPLQISDSVRQLLPELHAQGPHFITAHFHERSYLLTQGDTLRLPFVMKGVEPGDVIRLNRASLIGSRDLTLKAAAPPPKLKSRTASTTAITDDTPTKDAQIRLYVCRAVVMGIDSEPMRFLQKTKRRQRKVKVVKSKHKHTILRIKEVRVKSLEEIEA
ncbi:hypothetical protein K470DRAFT_192890, partial [Piedraia hortae CBS 480.64]